MTRRSRILTWGLPAAGVVALVAGGFTVAADRPIRKDELPPRPPTTAPLAQAGERESFIGAIGITEPPRQAILIAAHTGGVVEDVPVAVGDAVRRGDPLFRVDTRRAASDVRVREQALATARAEVDSLRGQIPTALAQVVAGEAAVESADAAVLAADADLADRRNKLRIAQSVNDPRAISSEEVDDRRFAAQQAEAVKAEAEAKVAEAQGQVAEARARLALLVGGDGADGPDLVAAVRRAEEAAALLDSARVDLDLLTARSPVDGTVIQVNIREGEFAPAKEGTDGLVVLARAGAVRVRVQIDEVDIPRFSAGVRAWASPRGDAERRIPLRLDYVEPLVVPKRNLSGRTSELVDTRVLEVVYAAEDDARLRFGQQMDVYIEAEPLAGAATP